MNAQQLLQEISDYCRQSGLAESTFGRRAVNDGKLAARLRNGGRITTDTLDRIHGFMAAHPPQGPRPIVIERSREHRPATGFAAPRPCLRARSRTVPLRRAGQSWRNFRRTAAQFPLLRQPAEISAVRQHLQREMGGRTPRLRGARPHPSASSGSARLRRRRRRRIGAHTGDARHARPLHPHAVLRGRQGNQPRGRAADTAENVRPLLRAPVRRFWC